MQGVKVTLAMLYVFMTCCQIAEGSVVDFDFDDQSHTQEGKPGQAVDGTYSWTSPEDYTFLVRYVADEGGYRVLESNAVPLNADGIAADGMHSSGVQTQTS